MEHEVIDYQAGPVKCIGHLYTSPNTPEKAPAVIVAHAWRGQDDFAREKAMMLAELGYVGFAADVYGEGATASTDEKAAEMMMPLFLDRALLQKRIVAAYDAVKASPRVDSKKIGAIGFCFGGLTVIELLRSGAEIAGAVSFHGVLGDAMGEKHAQTVPISKGIKGSLLILHGNDDPLVSQNDALKMQKELSDAKIDWQMHIYSHAVHAFTNPEVHDQEGGFAFNTKANKRAWQSMQNFFSEIMG